MICTAASRNYWWRALRLNALERGSAVGTSGSYFLSGAWFGTAIFAPANSMRFPAESAGHKNFEFRREVAEDYVCFEGAFLR
jgi:hypothetical protein